MLVVNITGMFKTKARCNPKVHGKLLLSLSLFYVFVSFLGAFAKLRKTTFNLDMSVYPSAWNNSPPTARIVMKFDI